MRYNSHPAKSAFTLVELSIVLVILGLLVGGVLTGQSLIRAAEIRSVMTSAQSYVGAVHAFRDKYFALPGDMSNATAFWGIAAGGTGTGATCVNAGNTGAATCNGDASGLVDYPYESVRFWQHLSNAGLIEGGYPGSRFETSVPRGKISGSYWFVSDMGTCPSCIQAIFIGNYGNTLKIGRTGNVNGGIVDPILKTEDAWNIDSKLDDGMPAIGKVRAADRSTLANCTTTNDNTLTSAAYLLTSTSIACALVFPQAF